MFVYVSQNKSKRKQSNLLGLQKEETNSKNEKKKKREACFSSGKKKQ